MNDLLEVKKLTFTYPQEKQPVLKELSFSVAPGEMVLLCGQSGSGKTTLLRHLKKNQMPFGTKKGEILLEHVPLEELSDRESAEKIGYVAQHPDNQIVTDTVWHELAFGLENLGVSVNEIRRRTAEIAEYFGIREWFRSPVDTLSGGQKQLLNLASVMVMQPRLLLLDEPTAQIEPMAAWHFFQMLQRIRQDFGTTILLCEQRLEEIMPLADRVLMLHEGEMIVDATREEVAQMIKKAKEKFGALPVEGGLPVALRSYFLAEEKEQDKKAPLSVGEGKHWLKNYIKNPIKNHSVKREEAPPKKERTKDKKNIAAGFYQVSYAYQKKNDILREADVTIEKGMIYGLLGGNGSGKTTALKLLAGIYKPQGGKVKTTGRVRYLAQNPLSLFTEIHVEDELAVMLPKTKDRKEKVDGMLDKMDLTPLRMRHPLDLSGGQGQRLALGKLLLTEPDVILLDEPTKGLDAAFKEKLARLLRELRAEGKTIVLVSHDLEFCAANTTHCGMMFDGTVMGSADTRTFFSRNEFYTTAAARMTKGVWEDCITFEDIKTMWEASME